MIVLKIDDPKVIETAVNVLNQGGLVVYPTETCYGVGVDPTNKDAVSKLLKYKQRPPGKAISIAVSSKKMADEYVEINESAEKIYRDFLPGPFTVISKSKYVVDKRIESELGTLGIRIPNFKLILDIVQNFNRPITATSANSSGKKTPYSVKDVFGTLNKKQRNLIDLVIDGGDLPKNPPSTVIDTTTTELNIYRQGRIDPKSVKNIENFISNSEDETIDIAYQFTKRLLKEKKDYYLILLDGELGAGKTHFTKGIAKALGITQIIKSPSYNYVNEYILGKQKMYHFDAWRIQDKKELEELNFISWIKNSNIIVVEWPTVLINLVSEIFEFLSYVLIEIVVVDENSRNFRIIYS